jgi:hypothetical protein
MVSIQDTIYYQNVLKQHIETYTTDDRRPCTPTMIEDQKKTRTHNKLRVIFEGTTV